MTMDDYAVGQWWGTAEDLYGGAGAGVVVLEGSTRPLFADQFFPDITRAVTGAFGAATESYKSYAGFQVAKLQAEAAIARARAQLTATPIMTYVLIAAGVAGIYYMVRK
jgi:hypothetical protein